MMVPEKGQAKETGGHEIFPGSNALLFDLRIKKFDQKRAKKF